ncbi:hypothetical protein EON65_29315 [archaeon]|nr:MAG: hypothetical protein EON65_29315 [archaeon]
MTSSVEELELQIADLSDTVELLTLDKEQLMIDKDILEEKLLDLQQQIEALKANNISQSSNAVGSPALMESLKSENAKLKDALFILNENYKKDKDLLEEEKLKSLELSVQSDELLSFKAQAESQIEDLKATVDSMSSFEDIIEKLTNENMELQSQVKEFKQTVLELEDAQEVNEELDFQQRKQIEMDKATIETLNSTITSYQAQLNEKGNIILDLQRKLEQAKESNTKLRSEVEHLTIVMSADFKESKEIEDKLKKYESLQISFEELSGRLEDLMHLQAQTVVAKYRAQAANNRLDALFGGTSFYIEESKLLNQETLTASVLSSGFDVSTALFLPSSYLTSEAISQLSTAVSPHVLQHFVNTLGGCRMHAATLQIQVIANFLFLLKTANQSQEFRTVVLQQLLVCKSLSESTMPRLRSLFSMVKKFLNSQVAAEERAENDVVWQNETAMLVDLQQQLRAITNQFLLTTDLSASARGTPSLEEIMRLTLQGLLGESHSTHLYMESMLLLVYLLLDQAGQTVLTRSLLNQGSDSIGDNQTKDSLKSFRDMALAMLADLKRGPISSLAAVKDALLTNFFVPVAAAVNSNSTLVNISAIRESFVYLRKVTNSNASTLELEQPSNEVVLNLRYFPSCTVAIKRTPGDHIYYLQDVHQCCHFYVDKYWHLLFQGSNDLIATDSGLSSEQSLLWKQRVMSMRSSLSDRLNSVATATALHSQSTPDVSRSPIQAVVQQATVLKSKYDSLVHDLDVKNDALQSSLNRVAELEEQLMQKTQVASQVAMQTEKEASSADVDKLKKEIQVLEEALQATEQRAETFSKELKALKAGERSIEPSTASGKPPRRNNLSHQNLSDALLGVTSTVTTPAESKSNSRASSPVPFAPVTTSTGTSNPTTSAAASSSIIGSELEFWRSTAMKRLVFSLSPLDSAQAASLSSPLTSSQTLQVQTESQTVSLVIKAYPDVDAKEEIRRTQHALRMKRLSARVLPILSVGSQEKSAPYVRKREKELWIKVMSQAVLSSIN